jgi:restriction endonuclease S subunit
MKHIKTYKIFESNQIWDLEDICQEIKDEGFSVNIKGVEWGKAPSELGEAKIDITNGSRRGNGISGSNFTMVQSMRDFLFRLKDRAREEGYEIYVRSNYGMLQLIDDGRILGSGCTCTPRYPGFTMMEISFAKL